MSLTSVSSSGNSEDRCVEALVSAPFNDQESARRWGVKLYFGGDVDLCNRRVRSMEEELSWTVSPQESQDPVDESAVYKWMEFCDNLPVIQSADQLDSVPSEHKGIIKGRCSKRLNTSAYMANDISTTHTFNSSSAPPLKASTENTLAEPIAEVAENQYETFRPASPRTERYERQLGFLGRPHRRRHSSSGTSLFEYQQNDTQILDSTCWTADENAVPQKLMSELIKAFKEKQGSLTTASFSDELNTTSIIKDAMEHQELLCPDHANALNSYIGAISRNTSSSGLCRHHSQEEERRVMKDLLDKVAEEIAQHERSQERFKQKIKSLEEEIMEEKSEVGKRSLQHKEEVSRLRSELESRTREIHELQKKDLMKTMAVEEERARDTAEFQMKLKSLEEKRQTDMEELREQIKKIQIELYETRDKLRLSEADLVVARSEVDRVNERMSELTKAHERKVKQLETSHKEEIEKITSDCEHLALSLKKIKSAYDVLKKSKTSIDEAEALERSLEKLNSENLLKDETIKRLEDDVITLRAVIAEKEKQVAEADILVQVKAKTLEEQNSYIDSILQRSADLQKETGTLRSTIQELQTRVKELQEQIESLQSRHVPEETSREWMDMKQTLMLQKNEIASKNRTLDTILKNLDELEQEKRLDDERRSKEEARKLNEKDAEIENLKTQLASSKGAQSKLEDRVAVLEKSLKDKQSEFQKLNCEVNELKQSMKMSIQKVLNSFN